MLACCNAQLTLVDQAATKSRSDVERLRGQLEESESQSMEEHGHAQDTIRMLHSTLQCRHAITI